jgi:transposase
MESERSDLAGIDIGDDAVFVAVKDQPVHRFGTFTKSYREAIRYLQGQKIVTVVMEATGVYWIALYEMLEAHEIEVVLVHAAYVKHLPGRKSDVADCEWLRHLGAHGLLRPCFIPGDDIRTLRSYMRQRGDHIKLATQHIQHMQKSLELMNIKLHRVISQIQGVSGLRIIKAIIAGERDPETLAALCDPQIIKAKKHNVIASLTGNYRSEHIFVLQQALECWEFYQKQILACDHQIELLLEEQTKNLPPAPPTDEVKAIRHNRPDIDHLHEMLMQMTGGKNPAAMAGLTDLTLLQLVSEIGTDLSPWKNGKHFASWIGLAPNMHQSGKTTKKRRRRVHTRVGQIFRVAAQSVAKSKNQALGGFYRRLKARRGPMIAMKALARKLAMLFYDIMTKGITYVEIGLKRYQEKYEATRLLRLNKQAKELGLQLVSIETVH